MGIPIGQKKSGDPKLSPTFRDLMEVVEDDSAFSRFYYKMSTSKTHANLILNPVMVRPQGRGTSLDSFSVGDIGLVLNLMLPLYEEILDNSTASCSTAEHGIVMLVVKSIFEDVRQSVEVVRATDASMHGGLDL